ncbi:MAG: hypothetical protein AAGU21_16055 [Solidesulfovibrio sp.]|uniref:hypothetical protein n=1 Tax=Solidesulfovibrio sp. TaxID=2910990 RepID=UPI002B211BEA|nr:hypothetical protein [Solidesulfovibrio sp.]MEA4856386.1 hypothetical protein [Solidesulfovibrio sp.]
MGQIVHLDDHRRMREPERGMATNLSRRRPHLSDRDLWTRDYGQIDNILYAILKIKEILDYHLYYDDVWPYLLLSFLEAVHNTRQGDGKALPGTGASLKDYVLSAITPANKRDLSMVLLLTDLIEKSPNYRGSSSSP